MKPGKRMLSKEGKCLEASTSFAVTDLCAF